MNLTPCINKAYDDDDDDDDDDEDGFGRNSDSDMRTFRNCKVERFEIQTGDITTPPPPP